MPSELFGCTFVGASELADVVSYQSAPFVDLDYYANNLGGRLKEVKNLLPSLATQASKYNYSWDSDGNIKTWDIQIGTATANRFDFTYDAIMRLTGGTLRSTGSGTPLIQDYGFKYDSSENRRTSQVGGKVNGFNFSNPNVISEIGQWGSRR